MRLGSVVTGLVVGLAILVAMPAMAAAAGADAPAGDVILLPGTSPGAGASGGGGYTMRSSGGRVVTGGTAATGARARGRGGSRRGGGGASSASLDELVGIGALSTSQANTLRALLDRAWAAQASGRPEVAFRARKSFRSLVDRYVRAGSLSLGHAQYLLESV